MQQHHTMQPRPGDRIGAYRRVSSIGQYRGGNLQGQDDQITRNLAGLKDEQGKPAPVEVSVWYVDPGRKRDRWEDGPDFQKMLKNVREGNLDWVVIETSDRMGSQHSFEKDSFINELLNHDCHLWSVQSGWMSNPDDLGGIVLGKVNDFQSREEIKKKSRMTMRGKIAAAERGEYCGGAIPYAFCVEVYRGDRVRFTVAPKASELGEPETLPNGKVVRRRLSVFLKKYPDGTIEEQTSFPVYEKEDYTRFVPTWEEDRLEIVRWIFRTFASADTTAYSIARTLNKRGIRPTYGVRWEESHIVKILDNPIYRGERIFRRETWSAYHEVANGEVKEKAFRGNRKLPRRRTRPEEQITNAVAELIDSATWEAAQRKREAVKTGVPKPARCADFWMRPIVHCAHCGQMMHGGGRKDRHPRYECRSHKQRLKGDGDRSACQHANNVDAGLLERVLDRWLEDAGIELDRVIGQESAENVPLAQEVVRLEADARAAAGEVKDDIIRLTDRGEFWAPPITGDGSVIVADMIRTWREFYSTSRDTLTNQIAALERDLEDMTDNFLRLKNDAQRQRAQAILDRKQAEVDALRLRLDDVATRLEGLWSDLAKRRADLVEAKRAYGQADKRRLAEAVRKVVARVEVSFCGLDDPEGIAQHTMGRPPAYLVRSVRVVPVAGQARSFSGADLYAFTNARPHPTESVQVDLVSHLTTRVYSGEDLRRLIAA